MNGERVLCWILLVSGLLSAAQAQSKLPHPWPPAKGQACPDLVLSDLEGNPVQLASFKGTPLLIHYVSTFNSASMSFTGGEQTSPFKGTSPQEGVKAAEHYLHDYGIDPERGGLLRVHVLLFGTMVSAPTLDDAKAWVKHFQLDERPHTKVFIADARYVTQPAFELIPGYQLVDKKFTIVSNATRMPGADDWLQHAIKLAAKLATPDWGVGNPQPPSKPRELYPEPRAVGAFVQRSFAKVQTDLLAAHAARKGKSGVPGFDRLLGRLEAKADAALAQDWLEAMPASYWAHLIAGEERINSAWEARGGGWASSVSSSKFKVFNSRLKEAKRLLDKALKLRPDLPYAPASLIVVCMGLGLEEPTMLRYFKAAQKADPHYMRSYTNALLYLHPKWHGGLERMLEFARECAEDTPDEPLLLMLEVDAHNQLANYALQTKRIAAYRAYMGRPKLLTRLLRNVDKALEAHPDHPWPLNHSLTLAKLPVPAQYERWRTALLRLSDLGSAEAAYTLGMAAFEDRGSPKVKPHDDAYLRFRYAADLGHAGAAIGVGYCFLNGWGVHFDPEAGLAWYRYADRLGDKTALRQAAYELAFSPVGKGNEAQIRDLLTQAKAKGDPEAGRLLQEWQRTGALPPGR